MNLVRKQLHIHRHQESLKAVCSNTYWSLTITAMETTGRRILSFSNLSRRFWNLFLGYAVIWSSRLLGIMLKYSKSHNCSTMNIWRCKRFKIIEDFYFLLNYLPGNCDIKLIRKNTGVPDQKTVNIEVISTFVLWLWDVETNIYWLVVEIMPVFVAFSAEKVFSCVFPISVESVQWDELAEFDKHVWRILNVYLYFPLSIGSSV